MLDTFIPQKKTEKQLYLCTKHVHFHYGGIIYIQDDFRCCSGEYIYDRKKIVMIP